MVVKVQVGIETRPRWATGARLSIVATKDYAFACDRVELGGAQARVTERRETIAAPLVSGDEKNVASAVRHTVTDLLGHNAITGHSKAWLHSV
jgi:hypothetical protein